MLSARNSQLDLLRAAAISMVVVYHVVQMSPQPLASLHEVTKFGQYGVELFFALSGWLIGRLYWNEEKDFGSVKLWHFWLRRWWRTIPPYLVALAFSWLAVFIHSKRAFDGGYLLFLQNYYREIPYFLVSWSLCVEEHFYLLMPLLLALNRRAFFPVPVLFGLLALVPSACRWLHSSDGLETSFGYEWTATHLRMEGLLLGFWLAYEREIAKTRWPIWRRFALAGVGVSSVGLLILSALPPLWMYRFGLSIINFGMASLLVRIVDRPGGSFAGSRLVGLIAAASFSIYLTHPLMIHAARMVVEKIPALPWQSYFLIVLLLIGVAGTAFYAWIEKPIIKARDCCVPRRSNPRL